jgi:hypothetical protein
VLVMVLPEMEQAALYDAINQDLTIFGRENRTVAAVRVGSYACPSDPEARPRAADTTQIGGAGLVAAGEPLTMAFTSYSACYGSLDFHALPRPASGCVVPPALAAQADGCFNDLAPIRLASIGDGLSHTIFVSEKATTRFRALDAIDPVISARYGWYVAGNWGDTLMTTFYPPNMIRTVAALAGAAHTRAASSLHPGGLHALMGDGSVRFVSDSIDTWPFDPITGAPAGATRQPGGWWENLPAPGIWQALATRTGGEVLGPGTP